jgi:hypothetical protein
MNDSNHVRWLEERSLNPDSVLDVIEHLASS